MSSSADKKWWVGSDSNGWEEATYPFSPTPVFGWNPEEGYYGRIFTTDADRQDTIDILVDALPLEDALSPEDKKHGQ